MLTRLNQQPPCVTPTTFTVDYWEGSIGGGALAVDPAPNTTPPSSIRTPRMGPIGTSSGSGLGNIFVHAVNGTSIGLFIWILDESTGLWVAMPGLAMPQTFTPTTGASLQFAGPEISGSRWFAQIQANTGCEMFGYRYY